MTATAASAVAQLRSVTIVTIAARIVPVPLEDLDSMLTNSAWIRKPTINLRTHHVMPSFTFTQSIAANGTFRPLDGWQYEYLPWPAEVLVLARAVAIGIVNVYTSGSETIVEESPVQAGGTAGTIPSSLNTPIQGWQAAAGDRLKLNYRNTTGAAVNVDGIIEINPL